MQGLIAGYGIAIPVGPITILIIELGLRRGFWVALCAGAGAASADFVYATIASLAGSFIVSILYPYSTAIHTISASALIALGVYLLYTSVGHVRKRAQEPTVSTRAGAYVFIFGLTLLNPLTVAYFTTLILSLGSNIATSADGVASFVSGAFLASLSWQSIIATVGGVGHERFSPKLREFTIALGNSIIILIGVALLLGIRL